MNKKLISCGLLIACLPVLANAADTPPGFEQNVCSFEGNSINSASSAAFKNSALRSMVGQLCAQGNQMNSSIAATLAQSDSVSQPSQVSSPVKAALGSPAGNNYMPMAAAPAPMPSAQPAQQRSAPAQSSSSNNIYGHS